MSRLLRAWPTTLFWVLGVALVLAVGYEAFTTQAITGFLSSDFYEHSAALRALLEDGLDPGAPMVVSDVGSARYMPHFVLIAVVGRLLSFDALQCMALSSTVNVALFVIGIFVFFRALFQDPRAPLYGLIVLLCSWYSAWFYSNVYQLHVLFGVASYPSQACVGLTMIALSVGLKVTRSRSRPWGWLALLAFLLAYILLTHPVTAVMALTATGFLALTAPGMKFKDRALLLAFTVGSGFLALLWPHVSVFEVVLGTGGGHASWVAGLADPGVKAARYVNDTYDLETLVQTLGLGILGIVGIGWFFYLRRHLFVAQSALAMLVPFLANFVVRIPLGSRFILLAVFFLHVGLVWMLLMITPGFHERIRPLRRPLAAKVTVAAVLTLMAVYNLRETWLHLSQAMVGRTPGQPTMVVRYGQRVGEIAGKGAVVLADREDAWPLPTFGVKIVALAHINPLLPDRTERVEDVTVFFAPATPAARRAEIAGRHGASHVVVRDDAPESLLRWLEEESTERQSVPNGYMVFTLRVP